MASLRHLATTALTCLLLTACGYNDNNDDTPSPEDAIGITVGGTAAVGMALAAATVEIIGPDGEAVAIEPTTTGADGSYTVVLPAGVELPVIVRIVPAEGPPLRTLVPAPAGASTEAVVANVNPITSAVADGLLGDSETPAELAAALSGADGATVDSAGDALVGALLGEGLDYQAFASDPDFIATSSGQPGSTTDAILDVLSELAQDRDESIAAFIAAAVTAASAPGAPDRRRTGLLATPAFQSRLVDQLLDNGLSSQQIQQRLSDPQSSDPRIPQDAVDLALSLAELTAELQQAAADATEGVSDAALRERVEDAVVDVIAEGLQQKLERLDRTTVDLATQFPATLRASFASAIVDRLVDLVAQAQMAGLDATAPDALDALIDQYSDIAAQAVAALDFSAPGANPSALLGAYLDARLPDDIIGQLAGLQTSIDQGGDPDALLDAAAPAAADVSDVADELQQISRSDPTLNPGGNVIEIVPGRWDQDEWNAFIWG